MLSWIKLLAKTAFPTIILSALIYAFVFYSIDVRLDAPQMSIAVLLSFAIVVLFRWIYLKVARYYSKSVKGDE